MGMKGDGEADLHEIDRFDGGVGWIAYPDEAMERASHAVAVPNEESETDDVWVFDPVDAPGLDALDASGHLIEQPREGRSGIPTSSPASTDSTASRT